MKKFVLSIAFLLTICIANAQKPSLAINEHNVYIYYEVVDLRGVNSDSLKKNASNFIKTAYPKNNTKKITDTAVDVKDKFLIYTGFVKHEDGQMAYTLNVECKDAKYRYWITDFVFTPYERDRYGAFVPSPGIYIPLEKAKEKLDKKTVELYINQTDLFCKQLAGKLKMYMATGHEIKKADLKPAKIVTDKW